MRLRMTIAMSLIAGLAPAARADGPPRVIRGKAFLGGSDRPAARVSLLFLDREKPRLSVVTDAAGRFRVAVPADVAIAEGRDMEQGPPCWMEPQDSGRWSWRAVSDLARRQPDYARKLIAEGLRQPVKTVWRLRAGLAYLEVRCPPAGEVEVLVRVADGQPIADRPVQVTPAQGAAGLRSFEVPRFDGRTDAEGRFRLGWFAGMLRLKVVVPGAGFGSTGLVEVRPGETARTQTPPLARLGSIEGRLEPALAGPSATVALNGRGEDILAEVACDAEGRFAFADVMPGPYWVLPRRAGKASRHGIRVDVAPAERIAGVSIGPERPDPRSAKFDLLEVGDKPLPDEGREVVWFEGTVRDEQGRGVAGARVFARAGVHSGFHGFEIAGKGTADARGHYQVRGPRYHMGMPNVMAHAEGRPPALAFGPKSGADGRPDVLDLTLPDARRGGSIRVTVLQDGRPMPGATVRLALMNRPAFPLTWNRDGPDTVEIRGVTHPSAVTGRDGVARFANLLPGRYRLTASAPGSAVPGEFVPNLIIGRVVQAEGGDADADERPGPAPVLARAEDVGVAEGRETSFVMAVHPQRSSVRFQVLGPDGTPLAGRRNVDLHYGLAAPSVSTSMDLDRRGVGRHDFGWPGLWSVELRFRDEPTDSDLRTEPYYRTSALLPISPAIALDQPIRMAGVRRSPGSIRVRLLDRDGRPARGTAWILVPPWDVEYAATSDEQGVVFPDLPSGEYELRGRIDGPSAPMADMDLSRPAQEDAAIRGRDVILPATAAVAAGRESAVVLRTRPVGYVRGTLRPRPGHAAADYGVNPAIAVEAVDSRLRLDPESGEFLHGPILPGRVEYQVRVRVGDDTWRQAGVQHVEVPAGDVAHVELRPGEVEAATAGGWGWPGKDVAEALEKEPGTVVVNDDRTPAFGALAWLYVPRWHHPVSSGFSDVGGRLHWVASFSASSDDPPPRDGLLDRPTVVVRIPGQTGAAIVPVEAGRPVRVTLPAPRVVEGRVTLGGRPVDGRNARIRVVAAQHGRGILDGVFRLEATAQADGRFELRGMTPGRYVVQAARDGIWLSRGVGLTVADDRDPPPLAMDIPEPGRAVELHVDDPDGRPISGSPIGLSRPEGPLASLWPKALHTGPDGILILRGLEAGMHALLIGEGRERREIVVPAYDGLSPRSVVVRIVVRGGSGTDRPADASIRPDAAAPGGPVR